MELSACQLDELRTRAEIARRVRLAEGHLPRPRPQAIETHKQGYYAPPGSGKRKTAFHRQSKLAPTPHETPVDSPEALRQTPGPEGPSASAGAVKAGPPV